MACSISGREARIGGSAIRDGDLWPHGCSQLVVGKASVRLVLSFFAIAASCFLFGVDGGEVVAVLEFFLPTAFTCQP